jgi:hypothetical protein
MLFQALDIVMVYIHGNIESTVYSNLMSIYTHFDMIFIVQELLLSTLYIHIFIRFMRQGKGFAECGDNLDVLVVTSEPL